MGCHGDASPTVADFNTEHEQFAVNARRPPDWVGHAHLANQSPDLWARVRPTNLALILIATANRAGSPCDATAPRSPASPAPSRAKPAARSDIATPTGADLRRTAEADPSAAAAGRPLDAQARQPQVPARRGYEHGRRAGQPGPKEGPIAELHALVGLGRPCRLRFRRRDHLGRLALVTARPFALGPAASTIICSITSAAASASSAARYSATARF